MLFRPPKRVWLGVWEKLFCFLWFGSCTLPKTLNPTSYYVKLWAQEMLQKKVGANRISFFVAESVSCIHFLRAISPEMSVLIKASCEPWGAYDPTFGTKAFYCEFLCGT